LADEEGFVVVIIALQYTSFLIPTHKLCNLKKWEYGLGHTTQEGTWPPGILKGSEVKSYIPGRATMRKRVKRDVGVGR